MTWVELFYSCTMTDACYSIHIMLMYILYTNDGRCTCEIKCRIAMAKAAFNKKRALFLLAHWTWN